MDIKKIAILSCALLIASVVANHIVAQTIESINTEKLIASQIDNMTNGYSESLRGDHIPYQNQWDDFRDALLTRATTGKVVIEWVSEPVTKMVAGKAVFLLQVCLDQANPVAKFAFSINDCYVGDIENFHQDYYTKELVKGVGVRFDKIGKIDIGDASFFMTVTIPEAMVALNQTVKMSLVGEAKDSNAWMLVFCHPHLTEKVKRKASIDNYYQISIDKSTAKMTVFSDRYHSGKKVAVKVDNAQKSARFVSDGLVAKAQVLCSVKENSRVAISCDGSPILNFSLADLRDTIMIGDNRTTVISRKDSHKVIDVTTRSCYSNTKADIFRLSESYAKDADVYIMVSSHQDIAWVDTPYNCVELRDKFVLSPAIDLLLKYPDYYYDMEDVLMLKEYITRHPDRKYLIEKLIKNGQLAVGASYTQPYEEMQSGEALVRQLYFGKRWVDKNFEGSNARTYWNVDVPGRTLQMPQILKKSGVTNLQYSRHKLGIFNWYSPDSSYVTTFTPGHYTLAAGFLRKEPENAISQFAAYCESFNDYRSDKSKPAVVGMLSAEDMSPAHTYYDWIYKMPAFSRAMGVALPNVKHATADMFFEAFSKTKPVLDRVAGERPNIWMYIHGPAHQKTLSVYREATKRAISAEIFSTIASLLKNSFERYPKDQLDQMWRDIIYADHGWGGKGGNVTDSLFDARYKEALAISTRIQDCAIGYIASHIKRSSKQGVPIVVFNQLSIKHSSPVEFEINTTEYNLSKLVLKDATGKRVPYQVVSRQGERATIEFVATDMPSIGYKTYFMTFEGQKPPMHSGDEPTQSDYYELSFEKGCLVQIYDKELKKDLFDSSKFEVAELFTMESYGNGAGEFASFQKPEMNDYESTTMYNATWKLIDNGAVYSLYQSVSKFKDADIVRYLKLYKNLKRIDFPVEINNFNGRKYREFRQAFALKSAGEVSYDVPFGTVTVGVDEIKEAAGERYLDQPSVIHPRSVAHWMGVQSNDVKINLTSSVVVMDYADPTSNPVENRVIQPILLASRKSCHWEGEYYYQKGDHHFNFSLRSDNSEDKRGDLQSLAAAYKMSVVVNPEMYVNASLALENSFFGVDSEGIVVSALKKSEDDDHIVIRVYDALSSGDVKFNIHSFMPIDIIENTDMLELNGRSVGNGNVNLGNRSIETYKLHFEKP